MTLEELDALQEDTRRLPHVADRVQQYMALTLIEIARQLVIMNEGVAAARSAAAKSGK